MSQNTLLTPAEARPLFEEQIVPAYQAGFEPDPWKEVSKCPDPMQRCIGGLSAVAINATCEVCGLRPTLPAYESSELIERFEALAATRPTTWYVERGYDERVTLAAIGWLADAKTISREKYGDVPAMGQFLKAVLPEGEPVMWLDEVFANRALKASGNLTNFGTFVTAMARQLGATKVAYRTIEPRMTYVAYRDFGTNALVMYRGGANPDRRDFIIIDVPTEEEL